MAGDHLVAVDDLGEGGVAVLVDAQVRHADAVLVVEVHGRVLQQHLEDAVPGRLVGGRRAGSRAGGHTGDRPRGDGDGTEHADPLDGTGEDPQQAQRDGRLPGVSLGGRHVDG